MITMNRKFSLSFLGILLDLFLRLRLSDSASSRFRWSILIMVNSKPEKQLSALAAATFSRVLTTKTTRLWIRMTSLSSHTMCSGRRLTQNGHRYTWYKTRWNVMTLGRLFFIFYEWFCWITLLHLQAMGCVHQCRKPQRQGSLLCYHQLHPRGLLHECDDCHDLDQSPAKRYRKVQWPSCDWGGEGGVWLEISSRRCVQTSGFQPQSSKVKFLH